MNRNEKNVNKLTMLGMMTALVFVSNYLRITMPIAIGGRTSFTLANIMCCLSGLLLGPVGGFASGLGSAIYDLTNPAYAPECWICLLYTSNSTFRSGDVSHLRKVIHAFSRSGVDFVVHIPTPRCMTSFSPPSNTG